MAQREEIIRRTVYVSDIDQQVKTEHLALYFFQYLFNFFEAFYISVGSFFFLVYM